ncbi:MAG: hypothetical protein HRT47_10045 [Candidatus Caenarcaniphilales bacterium]|nr:hypothetical protein [Candidatus Caenarcaniphilales bacterium]
MNQATVSVSFTPQYLNHSINKVPFSEAIDTLRAKAYDMVNRGLEKTVKSLSNKQEITGLELTSKFFENFNSLITESLPHKNETEARTSLGNQVLNKRDKREPELIQSLINKRNDELSATTLLMRLYENLPLLKDAGVEISSKENDIVKTTTIEFNFEKTPERFKEKLSNLDNIIISQNHQGLKGIHINKTYGNEPVLYSIDSRSDYLGGPSLMFQEQNEYFDKIKESINSN